MEPKSARPFSAATVAPRGLEGVVPRHRYVPLARHALVEVPAVAGADLEDRARRRDRRGEPTRARPIGGPADP